MLPVHAICWIGHNIGNALLPYDTPKIAGSPASTIHVKITIVSTAATPEMCIEMFWQGKGQGFKNKNDQLGAIQTSGQNTSFLDLTCKICSSLSLVFGKYNFFCYNQN